MKKSKWDKNKVGHYRPIAKCLNEHETFGEVCLECNECGRFKNIKPRKKKKKQWGIDYRFLITRGDKKWRRWKNYSTEKIRDEALKHLENKLCYGIRFCSFRKCKCMNKRK